MEDLDYDFSFFLVTATLVTGILWGGFLLYLRLTDQKYPADQPYPLPFEYARSFFPVVLVVMLLRSFLFEPFRIPSGSMMPTLLIGDFIIVNKYVYGIRIPVINRKVVTLGEPARGDIVVFRFPKDPTVDYIKRVIGLPGDRIGYVNKQISVNGRPIRQVLLGDYQGEGKGASMTGALWLDEDLEGIQHHILIRDGQPSVEGEFIVPQGHYFMMGDNRDNSNDSRYWGFVPETHLVGKAVMIWMNWDADNGGINLSRPGTLLH
ncbi:MAG: signal peptidase [Pseudomonadota bacterium]|jgi:signal peptidase I